MTSKIISQALPVPIRHQEPLTLSALGLPALSSYAILSTRPVVSSFGSDAGGWSVDKHVRLLGDTTGNGAADIIGFGDNGIYVSVNNGSIFVSLLTSGILVSCNNGGGAFGPAQLALGSFGYNQGWRLDKHLRFLADVTGDGLPDDVGFGEGHVFVARNNGNGTLQPVASVIDSFCIGAGRWRIDKHPRIIADLTGDGKADILGFGETGVYVSLNKGGGTFGPVNMVVNNSFSYSQGWRVEKHPRFVADLTGNKWGDIVGLGDAGVSVPLNNGDGTFQPAKLVLKSFGYDAFGWRVEKHLCFVVDLTGSGCADIIGFGEDAVWVSYNDGNGNFGPVQKLTDAFAFSDGAWALDKTVRYVANLYPQIVTLPVQ